jgi:membrane associated rhomboid family serine protease
VECGTETPRDDLLGPPDELRCRPCVNRRYPVYDAPAREFVRPLRRPPVTLAVMAAAVVVTLGFWSRLTFAFSFLADPGLVWDGQLWRLPASALPHLGILHLVFNLYWFWRFGKAAESWMGSLRFAAFLVATASAASAVQMLLGLTALAPLSGGPSGVGLSGVNYALFGLLLALRRDKDFAAEQMQPGVVQLLIFWFFLCVVLTYWDVLGVANGAHGGGFVAGWLVGWAVLARWRVVAFAGVILLGLGLVVAALFLGRDARHAMRIGDWYFERGDDEGALRWYRKAEQALPGDERLRVRIRQAEDNAERPRRK